MSIKFDYINGY